MAESLHYINMMETNGHCATLFKFQKIGSSPLRRMRKRRGVTLPQTTWAYPLPPQNWFRVAGTSPSSFHISNKKGSRSSSPANCRLKQKVSNPFKLILLLLWKRRHRKPPTPPSHTRRKKAILPDILPKTNPPKTLMLYGSTQFSSPRSETPTATCNPENQSQLHVKTIVSPAPELCCR